MNFFNPSNPLYRRSVVLLSTYLCTLSAATIVMADFGSQEHCFSPIQRYVIEKADAFFEITDQDLIEAQRLHNEREGELAVISAELTGRLLSMGKQQKRSEEKKE